jgi:hypothetical protein
MNFLARFLKVYLVALVFSALGALAFYLLVIKGSKLSPGVSEEEFGRTVGYVVGSWLGFITVLSLLLAFVGMKQTISVPIYDRSNFFYRANAAITSLRYRPFQQGEDFLIFKPPGLAVFAEKITVQLGQDSATITAPRTLLKKIRERI